MPSPIAHAVTGYCLGKICSEAFSTERQTRSQQRRLIGIATFASIAADFDFLPQLISDASFHRGISHSFGIAALCALALAGLFYRRSRVAFLSAAGLGFVAYILHLLMDLFTTGGRGIPVFWPLSSHPIQLPITIFPQVHHSEGLFYSGHIPVLIFETGFALLLLWLTQRIAHFYHQSAEKNKINNHHQFEDDFAFLRLNSSLSKSSKSSPRN